MKLKLKLVAVMALSVAALTGCGSEETTAPTAPAETTTETSTETSNEEAVAVASTQKSEIVSESGDTLVTEIGFDEAGNPVDVQLDIIMADGVSKYEAAAAGEYVMVEGSDNTWDKQVDAIEAFVVANGFDVSTTVDGVTGVSIDVNSVTPGIEEILNGSTEGAGNTQVSEIVSESGDTLVTEIAFDEAGNPVDVQIDIIMADGVSKYEAAAAGEYVMVEGSDNTWDKQVDAIEAFLVENGFDVSTTVDGVTGVSIDVNSVVPGVQEILGE